MVKLTNLLKEIITEVSIEQLKTQFVDSGKISQEDFNEITNATPKTAYITWLVKKVADKIIKAEDIYKYKKYFNIFNRRKKEYPFADINQYKTQNDLSQFINKSVEIADKESEDASQQKGVSKIDKYKEFYLGSVDGFNVYELPKDRKDLYGASCELGSGTEWCTATGKARHPFDSNISRGPLFIFTKPGSDEKYQFNYESEQFMDKNDIPILNKKDIKLFYPLFNFIENKRPQYRTPFRLKFLTNPESITNDDYETPEYLNLAGLPITTLPDNLKIKGSLNLSNTGITSLPDNLKIGDFLDLSNTKITLLPDNLKIKGSLNLSNTGITSLPDNLKIKGSLNLSNTGITSLPDNLEVKWDLSIANTEITSLPNNLKVERYLNIVNTPISKQYTPEQLLQMLPGVKLGVTTSKGVFTRK